jgi:O-antigen ligase
MSSANKAQAVHRPQSDPTITWAFILAAAVASVAVISASVFDLPIMLLAVLPVALAVGTLLVWNTRMGICFTAFAIIPLGVVQVEVASITLNLPEVLILTLFAKEAYRFLARSEKLSAAFDWKIVVLYVVASAIGIFTGLARGNGAVAILQDFRQFTEYIIFFALIVHRVSSRREIIQILVAFVSGGLLVAFHGIIQHFFPFDIPGNQLLSDMVFHGGARSGSVYGSTPLGAMMVLCAGPAVGLLLGTRGGLVHALLVGTIGMLVLAAVYTQTRASWMAMAIMFFFVFVSIKKSRKVYVLSTVAVLIFAIVLGPFVWQRLSKLQITKAERSLHARVQYYTTAWHIFRAHPIGGLGWGCHYSLSDILSNGRYIATKPAQRLGGDPIPDSTVHSAYLQLTVKAGLLGLLGFALVIFRWLVLLLAVHRARPPNQQDHYIFIGTAGALVGYLFHSSLENFFQWPVMAQSFWMLLGLTVVMGTRLVAEGHIEARTSSATTS